MKKQNRLLSVLSIETTAQELGLSVALVHLLDYRVHKIKTFFKTVQMKQSDQLFPVLRRLTRSLKPSFEPDLIVVDQGPGSFTGVRVGVSVARALAQVKQIPVVGITSLAAKAYEVSVWENGPQKYRSFDGVIMVQRQALPGEYYVGVYRVVSNNRLETVVAPAWLAEAEVQRMMKKFKSVVVVNDPKAPNPHVLLEMGLLRFKQEKRKKQFHFSALDPLYLQPSWAERKRTARERDHRRS